MKFTEKDLYLKPFKLACKTYKASPAQVIEKQPGGRKGMPEEIRNARGLYLSLCKEMGLKHNKACQLINMNAGNALVMRKKYAQTKMGREVIQVTMRRL